MKEIVRKTALISGETLTIMCEPDDSPVPRFEERIREAVESAALETLLNADRSFLDGWKQFPEGNIQKGEEGYCLLPLPPDFLFLGYLRLEGWKRGITELKPLDRFADILMHCEIDGVRESVSRPAGYLLPHSGEGLTAILTSGNDSGKIEEGCYMPTPSIGSDDTIEIPVRLVDCFYKTLVTFI